MTTVARTPATPATLDDLLAIPEQKRRHWRRSGEKTVRAEPFDAVDFFVGILFGDDEPEAEPPPSTR